MLKKKLPILTSLLAIITWNQRSIANENQSHDFIQHDNILIDNLSGNYGNILIENGFSRTFQLKNNYADSITILSLNIINDNNNSFFLNENHQELNCKYLVESGKYCNIPVFFKPNSIDHDEKAQLIIKYSMNLNEKTYVFDLSGKGRESSKSLKQLSKIGKDFVEVKLDENIMLDNKFSENIIPSVFGNNLPETYNYQNHTFEKFESFDPSVNEPDDYSRLSGYVFRVDGRAPHVPYTDDLCRKYNKLEDKIDCGIQDLGGFWPYSTMNINPTVEKIELMLNMYRKLTSSDYDIEKVSHKELISKNIPELKDLHIDNIENMNIDDLKVHLYFYLKDQLNLWKHVKRDYSYTGFVSTSTSPKFFLNYHESSKRNWIYVMYVDGGIKYYSGKESEIAVPGGIDWNDVMGYFDKREGKAYMRQEFESLDNEAYNKIVNVFSILNKEFKKPNYKPSPISLYFIEF